MKRSLISGSLAFDNIMQYGGQFADAILPDQLHKLNVSFFVPTMRREFGGCAANIAYNLKLLGGEPVIMATLGQDGDSYIERFNALNISTECIKTLPSLFTAQCFIVTDDKTNQINAFHPGAMVEAHINKVSDAKDISIAIVAPDGRDAMIEHAQQCAELKIPFIFDPGQGLPMFNGEELKHFIDQATYVATNDYEAELLTSRTGLSLEQIAERVDTLIVTRGEHGAEIYNQGKKITIPVVPAAQIADPTGCGDAFRAGILFGLTEGLDWETTGRIASLLGSIKIAHQGPQNHTFTLDSFKALFQSAFGYTF